jgi:phospholipase C
MDQDQKSNRHGQDRRGFLLSLLQASGAAMSVSVLPSSIRKALAIPAAVDRGTLADVKHIVILMQENRSFDHYFGTLRGVRGFGERNPIPLASGKPVWFQSNGKVDIPPFHLDTKTTSALRVPSTPHSFSDAQAAWNQGKLGFWPKFKSQYSMGHYRREDIPFQFALAEAFTICDAYHCSVTTGTDPNRIAFWSGSNFSPEVLARGENCTDADSEPDNLRCWIEGKLPEPGYTYAGSAFKWPTIPDVLQRSGISWRIYQDPNDNWTGAMHGCLAFESFRTARPDSPLYQNGMTHWSVESLAEDVRNGTLPQVSWVLPSESWSEHPKPSSPLQGAEFTTHVLDALTSNPEVWSKTVFFLAFDENDGLFDHVPPPAPPSYAADGVLAGKATLDLRGEYFSDPLRAHLHPADTISGTVRPWGLGPRVPFYVISPWSRGGWVNSQVFDHTSVAQFIEQRFKITIPNISPWHRAVCGNLVSAFDFVSPNSPDMPKLPDVAGSTSIVAEHSRRPKPAPPQLPEPLFQEPGVRHSRALPYELHVRARTDAATKSLALTFGNTGGAGAVFHVYDQHHLDHIPRRYTVEAGKDLSDLWSTGDGEYNLWVCGPNGFLREFKGIASKSALDGHLAVELDYERRAGAIKLSIKNESDSPCALSVTANAYRNDGPWQLEVPPRRQVIRHLSVIASHRWYDFTVAAGTFARRFAGRMETGEPGFSDPAFAAS